MAYTEDPPPAAEFVRRLAGQGRLTEYARAASKEERRWLRAGATEIAWPLVFLRVTRPIERRRGHHMCAMAVQRLEPECLDRFHDDVEAVLDDLFAHADVPIENLEGWLTMRMPRAVVDAYRRRRGERGAPQRPRLPAWLVKELRADAWLEELARAILDWVGTDATAGTSLWPLTAWADRRALATGDHTAGEATVAADIETVLAAMRRRHAWYENNVERPLGRKRAPVWMPSRTSAGTPVEPEPLVLVAQYERDDAVLRELAARAIDVLTQRIGQAENPEDVVVDVLSTVFGALPASHGLDQLPGGDRADPDRAAALINDPARLDRIVAVVLQLLAHQNDEPAS